LRAVIQSPVLRTVLVLALLSFAAFCLFSVWTEGGQGSALLAGLSLLAILFAVGLVFPGRRRIALRLVAGAAVAFCLVNFGIELWALFHGEAQEIRIGQPSAVMALIGVLVWGVPLVVYTLSGRSARERAEEAALAADVTYALRDRRAIDALAKAGADLDLPTEVRFYVDAPTIGHARSLENVLARQGCAVEVLDPVDASEGATCVVTQEMVPSWENIRQTREWLTDVATQLGGTVDGWEALVRSS
jgi:hypothetical protein